ncbi:phosphoesterase PA-phosphatase related protein [Ruminiclostridium papyrosolvens DSM 2782]|uniref:Phosphoesterase PA-phosphatase related protein n=1 Tax=Ruminiclostridium papyrosolvens DSM 2782 TaxID=588581 RepID=F1TGX4_9FIRM|nr:phosphatase PAP2 family protein [Ruminiclostridium papyrosolvens]EGD46455.1 phosphoesterase PA-phosphatase related protein [Ruminiclostridium papyrosolvens DSM 2782]WES33931.1 phosphatase PAP2 family protein [Ruminiclostridium papyrosolvens DSM 2782]
MTNNFLNRDNLVVYFRRVLFMLLIPMAQCVYFLLNVTTKGAHDVTTFLDSLIPFNEWFIIPYVFWYLYIFGILLVLAYCNEKIYYKLLFSILIGMFVCFAIYYIYPTTVPRPEVVPDNLLKKAVLIIYGKDRPVNCFPSIHMLDTILLTMFTLKYGKGLLMRFSSVAMCILIYMSTWFTKQHSVLDAVASTVLGTILFLIFENQYVYGKLESILSSFVLRNKSVSYQEEA